MSIPEPKAIRKMSYVYDMHAEPRLHVEDDNPTKRHLITKLVITIEDDDTGESVDGYFVDYDAWGYKATSTGVRDRSAAGMVYYLNHEWRAPFVKDAVYRWTSTTSAL